MARIREQPEREDRILLEIVVDAYDETERAIGWYCYLQEVLEFPFMARCISRRSTSPLEIGCEVEVSGLALEDDCMSEMHVFVKYGKKPESGLAVPLVQLACLSEDAKTRQAVEDWHYWVARGYEY